MAIIVEELEGEEEATKGKALGGEAGRRLLRLNRRGKERKGLIWSCCGNDDGRSVVEKWRGEIS